MKNENDTAFLKVYSSNKLLGNHAIHFPTVYYAFSGKQLEALKQSLAKLEKEIGSKETFSESVKHFLQWTEFGLNSVAFPAAFSGNSQRRDFLKEAIKTFEGTARILRKITRGEKFPILPVNNDDIFTDEFIRGFIGLAGAVKYSTEALKPIDDLIRVFKQELDRIPKNRRGSPVSALIRNQIC
jgi:hypothetical protein